MVSERSCVVLLGVIWVHMVVANDIHHGSSVSSYLLLRLRFAARGCNDVELLLGRFVQPANGRVLGRGALCLAVSVRLNDLEVEEQLQVRCNQENSTCNHFFGPYVTNEPVAAFAPPTNKFRTTRLKRYPWTSKQLPPSTVTVHTYSPKASYGNPFGPRYIYVCI